MQQRSYSEQPGECLKLIHDLAAAHAGPNRPQDVLLARGIVGLLEAEQWHTSVADVSFEAHAAGPILRRMLADEDAPPVPSLGDLLAGLADDERQALRLLLVDGLTRREAAAALKTSTERIRQLRGKALRRLRTGRELTRLISHPNTTAV